MAKLPEGKVIDIGAGESPWREWFPMASQYHGIDVRHASEFAMASRGQDIVLYEGKQMPFVDASFDGAICIEVLEHSEAPEILMSETARILKDGAPILLTVPWSARRHHIPHDYHRFTKERLIKLFNEYGFVEIVISERGNDIAVIANKMIVLTLRLLKPKRFIGLIWTLPIAILSFVFSLIFLCAAHVSMSLGLGSKEDPLGYFVTAVRKKR
jgi:SAM-dependent methyltransferase